MNGFGSLLGNINVLISHVKDFANFVSRSRSKTAFFYPEFKVNYKVLSNGNVIIIVSGVIQITDPTSNDIDKIKQSLVFEDAVPEFKFLPLKEIFCKPHNVRYTEHGMWFYSEDDFINSCEEHYWQDDDSVDSKENRAQKLNNKILKWQLKTQAPQGKKRRFDFCYGISVPGYLPLKNGNFDTSRNPHGNEEYTFDWNWRVQRRVDHFEAIVSIDRSVKLNMASMKCYRTFWAKGAVSKKIDMTRDLNPFYYTYISRFKNGRDKDGIRFEWQVDT